MKNVALLLVFLAVPACTIPTAPEIEPIAVETTETSRVATCGNWIPWSIAIVYVPEEPGPDPRPDAPAPGCGAPAHLDRFGAPVAVGDGEKNWTWWCCPTAD